MQNFQKIRLDTDTIGVRPTREYLQYKENERLKILLNKGNIPKRILNINLNDYKGSEAIRQKLEKYVTDFEESYSKVSLYFWSKQNCTQKSTMAQVIAKELLLKKYSCYFISMFDLLHHLVKISWDKGENPYNKYKFLIIDDSFDPRKNLIYKSQYQIPFLDSFLRDRIEAKELPVCFTSNFSPGTIPEIYTQSLKSLIVRSVPGVIEFNDPYVDFHTKDIWVD